MSEANTIFDLDGRIIATAKFGSLWLREPRTRVGGYDYGESGQIYGIDGDVVATFSVDGLVVRADDGTLAGRVVTHDGTTYHLLVGEQRVGKCIGCSGACSAALLFLFAGEQ